VSCLAENYPVPPTPGDFCVWVAVVQRWLTTGRLTKVVKKWDGYIALFIIVISFVAILVMRGMVHFLAALLVVLIGGAISYMIIRYNSNK
jgi:TctA family transporter